MRNEKYPILPGTVGEVTHIDDAGSIHMRWENGSSLALIPEIDSFQTVSKAKKLRRHLLHCNVCYHTIARIARVYLTQSFARFSTSFSVHLAACYLLRLELIWVQRKGKNARNYGGKSNERKNRTADCKPENPRRLAWKLR